MKDGLSKLFIAIAIASLVLNAYFLTRKQHETVKRTTIITERIDTIRDTVPQLITETFIKHQKDTMFVTEFINDTVAIVNVPITQKVFAKDSVYKAWVSGYDQNLDSLRVYFKSTTITERVEITKKDNRRFGVGPYVGVGYNFNNKKVDYSVGIGVSYNIFKF